MNTHPLVEIQLLKSIPNKRAGSKIVRRKELADKLVSMGIAKYVNKPAEKQDKTVIETKEEKHAPTESKVMTSADMDAPPPETEPEESPEPNDYSEVSVRKLADMIKDLSEDDLLNIVKTDERKTAVKLAEEEIRARG